jgi:hypothetical protein
VFTARCRLRTGTLNKTDDVSSIKINNDILFSRLILCRSQWPRGLRRGSVATRLLRLWSRIPPGA